MADLLSMWLLCIVVLVGLNSSDTMFNRPGVAGAFLKSPPSLIH